VSRASIIIPVRNDVPRLTKLLGSFSPRDWEEQQVLVIDALRRQHPNLAVNAQSVISKYNADDIEETIRQLRDELDLGFHAVGPVRGSTPEEDAKEITSEQVREIYMRTDRIRAQKNGHGFLDHVADSLLDRLRQIELRAMDSKKREFVCLAGKKMVVISHDAKVFPQDATMGDLRESDFDIRPILSSAKATVSGRTWTRSSVRACTGVRSTTACSMPRRPTSARPNDSSCRLGRRHPRIDLLGTLWTLII
jgi:MoaA/NifB/PqqE/SkfB family radical SAM enzyme